MEFSRNIDTEPMSRRQRTRFEAVREVLSYLTKQVVHEPIPATSDHYRAPKSLTFTQPEGSFGYTDQADLVVPDIAGRDI